MPLAGKVKNLLNRYIYIYIYIVDKVFRVRCQDRKLDEVNSAGYFWLQRSTSNNSSSVFRDIGWARGKGYLPVFASASLGLIVLGLSVIFSVATVSGNVSAASSITVTITDSSANLDLVAADGETISGESDTASFSVTTTSSGGYTATVAGGNSDGKLTGTSSANYFTPIASATAQPTSFSNGTWGFKPSKYNSSTNTDFRPVPTSSTLATIDVTNAPTTGNYTISVGAKTDTATVADTYSYSFMVAATTNSIDYDIVFANAASGMPERMSGSQAGNTITLPSTKPTMAGYAFKGWCTVSVAPNSACTGTTYQAGGTYTLASGSNNDVTLYAIWGEQTMQNFSCSSINIGDTVVLPDERDGITYSVGRLADGKCWMLDNLAFNGKDNKGNGSYITMDSTNTHINTTKTWNDTIRTGWTSSSQNVYDASYINDASKDVAPSDATSQAGQYKVGVYYNYCAATLDTICSSYTSTVASYDVCPKGWKLPAGNTSGDFSALAQAIYGSTDSTSDPTAYANYRAALRLPLSGYFSSGSPGSQGSYGYWWSTRALSSTYRYYLLVNTSGIYPADYDYRRTGYSIRCIAQ